MDRIHTVGSQITALGSHQIATLGGTQQIQCLTEEDKFIHPILDGTNYVNQSLITESGSVYCWSLTERQG